MTDFTYEPSCSYFQIMILIYFLFFTCTTQEMSTESHSKFKSRSHSWCNLRVSRCQKGFHLLANNFWNDILHFQITDIYAYLTMKKRNSFSLISNLLEKEVRRLVVRMETKCPEFLDLKHFVSIPLITWEQYTSSCYKRDLVVNVRSSFQVNSLPHSTLTSTAKTFP